jgi:hypothetical protein
MRILHQRTKFIPAENDMDCLKLHGLVVLADKYKCIPCIRFQARIWLQALRPKAVEVGRETLLLTSYIIDDAESINFISKKLILETVKPFSKFRRLADAENRLPSDVICKTQSSYCHVSIC